MDKMKILTSWIRKQEISVIYGNDFLIIDTTGEISPLLSKHRYERNIIVLDKLSGDRDGADIYYLHPNKAVEMRMILREALVLSFPQVQEAFHKRYKRLFLREDGVITKRAIL